MSVQFVPPIHTGTQFFDDNGKSLSAGQVYVYEAGTVTPKLTYADAAKTQPNTHPIVLDAAGRANIYLDGSYRYRLLDRFGAVVEDRDNLSAISGQQIQFDVFSQLQSGTGSAKLGYQRDTTRQPGIRTQRSKSDDRLDIRDFLGLDLNGNNDNAAVFQRAVDESAAKGQELNLPACKIALDREVTLPSGCAIRGNIAPVYRRGVNLTGVGADNPHQQAQLLITHPGKGLVVDGNWISGGRVLKNLVFLRNQPQPKAGWEPGDYDWDLYANNVEELNLENVRFQNATRGFYFVRGQRVVLNRVGGQFFKSGFQIDSCYDVNRIFQFHGWPYWDQSDFVRDFTQANLDLLYTKRNDNPMWIDLFSIWHKNAVRIGQIPDTGNINLPPGTTQKLKIIGADLDIGNTLYFVDPDVSGHTAHLTAVTGQGLDTPGTQPLVHVLGRSCNINTHQLRLTRSAGNLIRVEGQNNTVILGNPHLEDFNMGGQGFPAAEAIPNKYNRIIVTGDATVLRGNGAPLFTYNGAEYRSPHLLNFNLVVRGAGGNLGSAATIHAAQCRIIGEICEIIVDFTVSDKGTATGLQIGMPFMPKLSFSVLVGREVLKSGKMFACTVTPNDWYANLTSFDGTVVHLENGARYSISGQYRI